ncbi:MAG TPA: hypothetical protein VNX68_11315, partial [Nitrosopumilaceae archaeon]|nr:hypothetical protein [Nitrosopumilaceae archaeon]
YLGASIGWQRLNFTTDSKHTELDDKDTMWRFKTMTYEEIIQTTGNGVNLKMGAIYRVSPAVRVGASVQTPTKFWLTDVYSSTLSVTYHDGAKVDSFLRGQTFMVGDTGTFKYNIVTPMKATASVALLASKFLAVNMDIEYVNYKSGHLSSTPMYFTEVNKEIQKKYTATSNIRIGVESNIKPVIIRAGFATYGSQFGNMLTGKFVRNSYSAGVGFHNNDKFYVDLAVVITKYTEDYYLYNPLFIHSTKLDFKTTTMIATIGKKF